MMVKGIRIRPSSHPRYGWEAVYATYVNGIRTPRRRYFKTKTGAQEFRARHSAMLASAGTEIGELRPDERRALSIWRERRRTFPSEIVLPGLDEIVRQELDRIAGTIGSVTIRDAVDSTVGRREREGRKATTIRTLYQTLGRFEQDIGPDRLIATVTAAEINEWLQHLTDGHGRPVSQRTRLNYRKGVATLFNEAVRNGWCERNPVANVDKPRLPEVERIAILTPEELAALLRAAGPEARAAIVLGGLCGLRSSEVTQLDWRLVNLSQRHVRVNRGKTGKRLAPLPDNAIQWLRPLALPAGPIAGKFTPARLHVPIGQAFKDAGVQRENNSLRHSFCSYRLALTQNLAQTALEAGNSPNILQKHYMELVTQDLARAWFNVRPGRGDKAVPIAS